MSRRALLPWPVPAALPRTPWIPRTWPVTPTRVWRALLERTGMADATRLLESGALLPTRPVPVRRAA